MKEPAQRQFSTSWPRLSTDSVPFDLPALAGKARSWADVIVSGIRRTYRTGVKINMKHVWSAAGLLVVLNLLLIFWPMLLPKANIGNASSAPAEIAQATSELVSGLNQSGLNAAAAGAINKDDFSVQGTVVTIAGDNIQVFEYPNPRTATREAEAFLETTPGAGSSAPGAWQRAVSLYVKGPLIIFYMGSNERIVEVLDSVAGPAALGGGKAFE